MPRPGESIFTYMDLAYETAVEERAAYLASLVGDVTTRVFAPTAVCGCAPCRAIREMMASGMSRDEAIAVVDDQQWGGTDPVSPPPDADSPYPDPEQEEDYARATVGRCVNPACACNADPYVPGPEDAQPPAPITPVRERPEHTPVEGRQQHPLACPACMWDAEERAQARLRDNPHRPGSRAYARWDENRQQADRAQDMRTETYWSL